MEAEPAPIDEHYVPPSGGEMNALAAVLEYGVLSGGAPVIDAYQDALAARFGTAHAVAVNSGSSALYAVLHALGAGPGRSVLLPSFAPLPTVLPVLVLGARPVLVDNQPGRLALDKQDLAAKIRPDTAAVISVPLWGYPADTAHLTGLLATLGVPLLEDAAQAHGTISEGRPAGTTGIAGCFSTHDRKLISTGEGGFILTDDPEIWTRTDAFTRLGHLCGQGPAVNFKLAAPLAAIGLSRLAHLDQQIQARTANATRLLAAVDGAPLAELAYEAGGMPNYYGLVLLVTGDPEPLTTAFTRAGLPPDSVRWNHQPLHRRAMLADYASDCPNAEDLIRRAIHLPVHPGLTPAQLQSVADRAHTIVRQIGAAS